MTPERESDRRDLDALLEGLRPLVERTGPDEPIIADDDVRIGDIKALIDEIYRLRAEVVTLNTGPRIIHAKDCKGGPMSLCTCGAGWGEGP